ncbi:hypothetical protein BH09BAC5_BH09BAC5_19100 [soil metagenome]
MSLNLSSKPLAKIMEEMILGLKSENKSSTLNNVEDIVLVYSESLNVIAEKLEMSQEQALFYSIVYYYTLKDGQTYANEIVDFLQLSPFDKMRIEQQLNPLVKSRQLHRQMSESRRKKDVHYFLSSEVAESISKNSKPEIQSVQIDIFSLIDKVNAHYKEFWEDMLTIDELEDEIKYLETVYNEFEVFKLMEEYQLTINQKLIFMYLFSTSSGTDRALDVVHAINNLVRNSHAKHKSKHLFRKEESLLFNERIIEFEPDSYMQDKYIRFTPETILRIFGEEIKKDEKIDVKFGIVNLLKPIEITPKSLFYNASEAESISMITSVLQPEKYDVMIQRLADNNMPQGITILLHGFPGTGKTESVFQLAKAANRVILQVDISQVRDKYVGESEKRLKSIFDTYRKAIKKSDHAPILFFNEADALIGKRLNVSSNVDQMNNIMQNILLEELENFKGIFMATTNLMNNMDTAFDRRFLFKVKFEKPSIENRSKIWKSKLNGYPSKVYRTLAEHYDLSGGQMDNIARKVTLKSVVEGIDPNAKLLYKWCDEELMRLSGNNSNRIGFK